MSVYGRDELTDLEKFLLITAGSLAVEHYTNKAAVAVTGMGYRRLFSTSAAIFIPAYLAGHYVSYRLDPDHGTQRFADTVSDIVTLNVEGLHRRGHMFVSNLVQGGFFDKYTSTTPLTMFKGSSDSHGAHGGFSAYQGMIGGGGGF